MPAFAEFVAVRWKVPSMGATTMQVSARTGPKRSMIRTSSPHCSLTAAEVQNQISGYPSFLLLSLRKAAISLISAAVRWGQPIAISWGSS